MLKSILIKIQSEAFSKSLFNCWLSLICNALNPSPNKDMDNIVKYSLIKFSVANHKRLWWNKSTNIREPISKSIGPIISLFLSLIIKANFLITKPTNPGIHISLNKEKITEIESFIFKVLGYKFN